MLLTKKIETVLGERIKGGVYRDGEKLPSIRDLSDEFGASYVIVSRAIQSLKADGLVETSPGRGTFAVHGRSSFRHWRERRVCFVFADPQSNPLEEYQLELYSIIQRLLREHGFIDVAMRSYDSIIESPETLAGAIIIHRSQLLPLLREHHVPLVYCSSISEELPYSSVTPDFYQGSYEVTRFLATQNYQKIAFVAPYESDNSGSFRVRYQGYMDALSDRGLAPLPQIPWHAITHADELRNILLSPDRPQALFVGNDHMALEVMALARTLGLELPRDLGIAGLEDMRNARLSTPKLTTATYDKERLAAECVNLLMDHIQNGVTGVTSRRVPMELVVRDSTLLQNPKLSQTVSI